MAEQINNEFFSLLHLACLRKIIKENPEDYELVCSSIGKEIGARIIDDFCSKHYIMNKIKRKDIEHYIRLFFSTYFDKTIEFKKNAFKTKEMYEEHCGLYIIEAILNEVFECLSGQVKIEIDPLEDGFVVVDLIEDKNSIVSS